MFQKNEGGGKASENDIVRAHSNMGKELNPCSPRPKRCRLGVSSIDPRSAVANALSLPPGKYERKLKTQRNRRGLAQAVEYVV